MLTGNGSVKRFDVSITYTHMRAADGSDDRGCATWLLTSMRERVNPTIIVILAMFAPSLLLLRAQW